MKSRNPVALILLGSVLPMVGLCEETNNAASLFGITVTQTVSEAEAQFELGSSYYSGFVVEKDLGKAFACFKKAAELGHAQAQFNLGLCYMKGIGVEQNDKDAALWFKKAALQDVAKALYPLGICYYNLEQYGEAYAWALVAEAKGDNHLKGIFDPMFSEEEIAAGKTRFEELKKQSAEKKDKKAEPEKPE